VALTLVVRLLLVQAFYIPSASMEPTLQVGDRVLVSKPAYVVGDVRRGDVVVFDGRDSFAAEPVDGTGHGLLGRLAGAVGGFLGVSPSEQDFVKRVVGVGGDRVVCCDADGRLSVNGTAVDEPYLAAGDAPSEVRFDVVVPPGRLWVMGDHRSDSADSRAHLGDPGGGTVPLDRVVGEVVLRFWPVDRAGRLSTPSTGEPS
jgi:signal peptidase I